MNVCELELGLRRAGEGRRAELWNYVRDRKYRSGAAKRTSEREQRGRADICGPGVMSNLKQQPVGITG